MIPCMFPGEATYFESKELEKKPLKKTKSDNQKDLKKTLKSSSIENRLYIQTENALLPPINEFGF